MIDLPLAVIRIARKPTALAKISDRRVRNRIFELNYNSYVLDDVFSSRIVTTKSEFRPFATSALNAYIRMMAKNVEKLQNEGDSAQLMGLVEAAFLRDSEDPSVKISIDSPGHIAIVNQSVVPLVAVTVLGILTEVAFEPAAIAQDEIQIEVSNSLEERARDQCSHEVGQLTQSMLKFLPEEEFQESCELLRRTHESTGAESSMLVEKEE